MALSAFQLRQVLTAVKELVDSSTRQMRDEIEVALRQRAARRAAPPTMAVRERYAKRAARVYSAVRRVDPRSTVTYEAALEQQYANAGQRMPARLRYSRTVTTPGLPLPLRGQTTDALKERTERAKEAARLVNEARERGESGESTNYWAVLRKLELEAVGDSDDAGHFDEMQRVTRRYDYVESSGLTGPSARYRKLKYSRIAEDRHAIDLPEEPEDVQRRARREMSRQTYLRRQAAMR